jgi:hypothetical protein
LVFCGPFQKAEGKLRNCPIPTPQNGGRIDRSRLDNWKSSDSIATSPCWRAWKLARRLGPPGRGLIVVCS